MVISATCAKANGFGRPPADDIWAIYDAINQCMWAITASRGLIRLTIKGNKITVQDYWRL